MPRDREVMTLHREANAFNTTAAYLQPSQMARCSTSRRGWGRFWEKRSGELNLFTTFRWSELRLASTAVNSSALLRSDSGTHIFLLGPWANLEDQLRHGCWHLCVHAIGLHAPCYGQQACVARNRHCTRYRVCNLVMPMIPGL